MSDLISREDAIDALQKEINKGIPPFDDVMGSIRCGVRLARNIVEDLPSAQPEIIRCKDCRHGVDCYHDGDCYCSNPKWGLKYFGGSWEFYCADAERRTDEW